MEGDHFHPRLPANEVPPHTVIELALQGDHSQPCLPTNEVSQHTVVELALQGDHSQPCLPTNEVPPHTVIELASRLLPLHLGETSHHALQASLRGDEGVGSPHLRLYPARVDRCNQDTISRKLQRHVRRDHVQGRLQCTTQILKCYTVCLKI